MRQRLLTSGLILLIFLTLGALTSGFASKLEPLAEAYNPTNLIRLHVVANSDEMEDQKLKLKVRDRILAVTEPLLLRVEDPTLAEGILTQALPELETEARNVLLENGRPQNVKVTLGKIFFPDRNYSFGILPAGYYKGLRVELGKGEGKNWWCVLYPPLCLLEADAPTPKQQEKEKEKENTKVEFRLAFLENLVKQKGLTMNEFWVNWGKVLGIM